MTLFVCSYQHTIIGVCSPADGGRKHHARPACRSTARTDDGPGQWLQQGFGGGKAGSGPDRAAGDLVKQGIIYFVIHVTDRCLISISFAVLHRLVGAVPRRRAAAAGGAVCFPDEDCCRITAGV